MAACLAVALFAFVLGAALMHAVYGRRALAIPGPSSQSPTVGQHAELAALAAESMFKVNRSLQSELAKAHEQVGAEKQKSHTLSAEARTDQLTGLPNRRVFDEQIECYVERERANRRQPLTLMLIDVDHFKQINDRHGHPTGDAALQWLARILRQQVAEAGLPARFGGEEFAVLCPACEPGEAIELAERLRLAIASVPLEHRGLTLCITASIGMALSLAGEGSKSLTNRADEALYAAKKNGRNRVYLHNGASSIPAAIAGNDFAAAGAATGLRRQASGVWNPAPVPSA
ncbi:MAG TPA: GGDEF domain-containing protein [Pirellulales bacterium]|nr:GGDEF domain-containing protein [Pirellulales bacterium]